jgi:hypothetical protein
MDRRMDRWWLGRPRGHAVSSCLAVMIRPPTVKVDGTRSRAMLSAGWLMHVVANVGIGVVAGVTWPVVYIMGYVIAGLAGWTVGDPTLTDDGLAIPIGMGVIVIVFIVGTFLALNMLIARRAPIPVAWCLTAAAVVTLLASVVTEGLIS